MIGLEIETLLVIVFVVVIDLAARWLAYNKIDSISQDICIFSFVYQLLTMISQGAAAKTDTLKVGILFILFAAITIVHRWLLSKTQDLIEPFVASESLSADVGHRIETISRFLLEVDLAGRKQYKKRERQSLVFILNGFGIGTPANDLFLLGKSFRRWIHGVFIVIGILVIIAVSVEIKSQPGSALSKSLFPLEIQTADADFEQPLSY